MSADFDFRSSPNFTVHRTTDASFPYYQWANHIREELKSEQPAMNGKQRAKAIAKLWKASTIRLSIAPESC